MTCKTAFLIPVYNHHRVLEHIVTRLTDYSLPCLLVNDGSAPECREEMQRIADSREWVSLIHLPENQGKGGAVMAGIRQLAKQGFSHVFQIDADGQHDLNRIPAFLAASAEQPQAMILGQAIYDDSVPKSRLYGRYITHVWVWIETLSLAIRDSMCGFRIYPVEETHQIISSRQIGMRMDFDVEIVVRLHWAGVPTVNLPVPVNYPMDGISHFDVLNDNLRISKAHTKLFFGMLWRMPVLLFRSLSRAR
ncbi:MAG: glycosyltransferase family 2 protein [Ketobacteraceae bacterium]|nr:glycosyltransferase family 2 protein [Ketobacteraceae bacterium]